jgi:hypothetical protein
MSKIQVDTIDTRSGTATMQIGSTNTSTINLGVSGDTVNIPSGVTIANAGTATGFGESNTPYFKAYTSGSTQQANSGAYLDPVAFATEYTDSDGAFSSNVFTVPSGKGGKYFFHTQIQFIQNMYDCYLLMVKNSTNVLVQRQKRQSDSSLWYSRALSLSGIIDMAAGDTMKVKVYAETSDSQYNIEASETQNYFEGFRIAT